MITFFEEHVYSFSLERISEQQSVTCQSYLHPPDATRLTLTLARGASTRFTYPGGMEG